MHVWPKNDNMRKYLKHPTAGGFREDRAWADWPADKFTFRRLRDGDITKVEPKKEAPPRSVPRITSDD